MSFLATAAAVCFISCHGGPADHFATFAEALSRKVGPIEICASGPALEKFQERGIEVKTPFSLDSLSTEEEDHLAEKIAKVCSSASVIITDVGHAFDIKIQKALAAQAPHAYRYAYYDNPEPYVPGGYSAVAAQVMRAAHGILFANSHFAKMPLFEEPGKEIDLSSHKKVGIGYYPIHQAEKMAQRRAAEQLSLRRSIFSKNGWIDSGQKIWVYFGGNNEEYFTKALPAFLNLLEEGMEKADFTPLVIVIQQHPGAKGKNIDGKRVLAWIDQHKESKRACQMILSDFSSNEAQILADVALYYQTSMGPQFVLAGIPTVQIGHKTFEDILVRSGLSPSVTNVHELLSVRKALPNKEIPKERVLEELGIKLDWPQILEKELSR